MTNFLNLVLIGHFNEQNYLEEYFLREQKRVKEEYNAETFFSKCLDVVQEFKNELERNKHRRKMEIFHALQNYREPEKHEEEIKQGYKAIKELKREDFFVDLFSYCNPPVLGSLDYGNILELETAILKAIDTHNLQLDFDELSNKYLSTKRLDVLFPFKKPFFSKDNFYTLKTFLNSSLERFNGIVLKLPVKDKIQLKEEFQLYLMRLTEGAGGGDYKELLNSQIELVELKYQKLKIQEENSQKKNNNKKPGRPPAIIQPAQNYLQNIELEERKILFIEELKKIFQGCEPKTFNYLVIVLLELNYVKEVSQKELKNSFEQAINPQRQSMQNFRQDLSKRKYLKETELFASIKRQVLKLTDENLIV
ncbi:hypothetical protein [Gramella sp. KN1008]|uniref:hypothetical protein n=1 Tax=Gramella sp. KN1008 TaxID=2529298 RepID=UPI00103CC113|nr:hypothetical protein [Gramella sp. KN1008]TBW28277.1 hypothetical protein EZJ28_05890 [Gramella sp. KN1008]